MLTEQANRVSDRTGEFHNRSPAQGDLGTHETIASAPISDHAPPVPERGRPGRVGDYRILRLIGRGGMGAVYEAVQESLGRHVALKLLPAEALVDPLRLERFRREARSAAQLHHTNIVPVFGVGEADGRHFYAMQFIAGHPLDAVIEEVRRLTEKSVARAPHAVSGVTMAFSRGFAAAPTAGAATSADEPADWMMGPAGASDSSSVISGIVSDRGRPHWVTIARLGAQAADALAYAHAQGILHRDIKPANLLLDLQGTVWVTDFGLAKPNDAENLTEQGDIVGTLRYMAPERFDGSGDHRADIYALGLTVYEMLTLKLAFHAENRVKLIEQVTAANPPRPRSINPAIPRDLETIVLKAIQREPALRYQSAADFGDDLRRYIEDRPIRARRATLPEQTLRWCRRNPAIACLVAAVMLATLTGAGLASFYAVRAENERGKAEGARKKAVEREYEATLARKEAEAASARATIARHAAEESAEEARKRLTRLYVFTGVRYQDDGDISAALLWFHRAWEQDHADHAADAAHRTRIAGALAEMPDLIGACFHKTKVCDAIFSPDGRRVLARTDGNEAFLWDYEQGQLAAPALVHAGRVRHIAFSPDGRSVATASADGTACVWDSTTGAKRFTLKHDGPLTWVAFHPDGVRMATAAEDRTVRMWSTGAGKPLVWQLPVDTVVDHVAFSPDGSRLLSASRDKLVRVWDVDRPQAIYPTLPYRQPTDTERYAFNQDSWPKFAADGRAVLSSNGTGLAVWAGGATDAVRMIPFGSRPWVVETYLVPNSDRVFVTGNSHVATVVELKEGKVVHELSHPREANLGAVSPDGKWLLTCSSGGLVTLWDAATGLRAGPPQRSGDFCSAVVFSPDNSRYLAASQDGTVRVWSTRPRVPPSHSYRFDCGRANLLITVMNDQSTRRSYSPDGRRWVEWTEEGKAWYSSGPNAAPRPIAHPGPVDTVRFSDDGSRLVVDGGRAIRAWHAHTLAPAGPVVAAVTLIDPLWRWNTRISSSPPVVAAIPADPRENTRLTPELIRPVQLSRDGTRIVCLDDEKTLSVWDLTTGRRVFGPARHPDPGPQVFEQPSQAGWVTEAALSADGRRLAVAIETTGTLTVWNVETGQIVHHNRRFRGYVRKVQFSDDGRRILLSSSDGMARMYDAESGIPLGPAVSQPGGQLAVGVSPDGRRLAVYDDHASGFRMFDVERGERLLTIRYGKQTRPTALWFDAAGRSLNAVVGAEVLTFPLPRFDLPFANSKPLLQFLTGQQVDATEGVEFVDQSTFRKDPDRYRDVLRAWKSPAADRRSAAPARGIALFLVGPSPRSGPARSTGRRAGHADEARPCRSSHALRPSVPYSVFRDGLPAKLTLENFANEARQTVTIIRARPEFARRPSPAFCGARSSRDDDHERHHHGEPDVVNDLQQHE
jgi:eukaryotic-like serine/threonine-protein kinase